ncbi:CD1375 family protein [Lysinibacillus sp. NPDC093216]|uniref:CD1375 family protein n=1 Tax=Lysinibacillus sp. NPDC093216 TaxID=3390576 RepID=UPI003D0808D1
MIKLFIARLKLTFMEECRNIEGYTILIMNGLATINRVPVRYKEAVLANLGMLGLNGDGKPIKEQSKKTQAEV